jgi:hypothetical protein
MEFILFIAFIGFFMTLPAFVAYARGKPCTSWAAALAWCVGVPVLGWFVGLYLALKDD